mgnify:CR=1 FL=1
MKNSFVTILCTILFILLAGCQTVTQKIDQTTELEKKELSKWLNKSEEDLKSFYGQPDKVEFLKTRNQDYVSASIALGNSEFRTIFRHILPNSIAPVLVAVAFGVASAILTESGLSFLGLGAANSFTWGAILAVARGATYAWWLALFPGLAIFICVTVYNLVGEGLRDALDPRLKQ